MRLVLAHTRISLLTLSRYPAFAVPTILLPTLFFLLFGLPNTSVPHRTLAASFAAFAVFSVVFFQFGVGIAGERESAWEIYLRTLPVSIRARFAARMLAAGTFATVSAGLVLAVAGGAGYAGLTPVEWVRFLPALAAGAVPLALLGIAVGYWVTPKGALPVANVLYLVMSYAGGLWSGPRALPSLAGEVAPLLPTRQWADVLWPAVLGGPWQARHWLTLLGFAVVFGLLAAWGYRRDEGQRFR